MSDDSTTPHSGSRWEPRTDASGAPTPPPPVPAPAPFAEPADTGSAAAGRSSWTPRVRGRGGLLAGGLALVLAAGVGGYAVGEAAQHGGDRPAFGVGFQPQDATFPAPPPGGDDHGSDGHSFGDDDGGQLGGQLGGSTTDDGGAQQGGSL
jgi:hypothetical protein